MVSCVFNNSSFSRVLIALFCTAYFSIGDISPTFAQECVAPPADIVAWWPFDEAEGTSSADIVGGFDGTHVNDPTPALGKVGGALHFDGTNDYVVVPGSDNWNFGTADFTVEFWANFDRGPHGSRGHPGDVFISYDEGPFNVPKWFFASFGNNLEFLTCCGTGWAFSPIVPFARETNRWYHFAATRAGTRYKIYIDGVLVADASNAAVIGDIDALLSIGRALEPFGGYMDGHLDEMTIYHRTLTESELKAIADAGSAGKCKGLTIATQTIGALQLSTTSSQQLEAVSGTPPLTWSILSGLLPLGMNLGTDGVFSGTPTELGTSTFTAQVTDSVGAIAEKTFTVEVVLLLPPPDIQISKISTTPVPGRQIEHFLVIENVGKVAAREIFITDFLDESLSLLGTTPASEPNGTGAEIVVWGIDSLNSGETRILSHTSTIDASTPLGINIGTPACSQEQLEGISQCVEDIPIFRPECELQCGVTCGLCPPACIPQPGAPVTCSACIFFCGQCIQKCSLDLQRRYNECFQLPCEVPDFPTTGPIDPNEKLVSEDTFIQPDQLLVYPIHFENIGEVEAIDVFVTDVLDPNLDESTLELLTPDGGSFDPATRTVRWELLGRNLQPTETDNVLLSIRPKPGLSSGTEIRNSAEIQFEIFDPLITPEVINIIDTTLPDCSMTPLSTETVERQFEVSWSGTDAIGEIESYSVFVSVDSGTYTPFLNEAADTSAIFTGEAGKTYDFFCVAKDTAGNVEDQALAAEATTHIALKGDFNDDGCVSKADYNILMADIRSLGPKNPEHDLNGDGVVNRADARTLVGLFTNPRGAPCN